MMHAGVQHLYASLIFFCQQISNRHTFLALNLNIIGHSHAGSLFINEGMEKLGPWITDLIQSETEWGSARS